MKRLVLSLLVALAFPASASALEMNITANEESWPVTTQYVNGWGCVGLPAFTRCIKVYNHSGYGRNWVRNKLRPALAEFNKDEPNRFKFIIRHSDVRYNLDTQAGIEQAYTRKHFGGIVIGRGFGWEVDISFGQMNGDPEIGTLPFGYADPYSIKDIALALVAIDNRGRVTVEHELGHALGLTHWPLVDVWDPWQQDYYAECVVKSIMCALGEDGDYMHLVWQDYRSLRYLYY